MPTSHLPNNMSDRELLLVALQQIAQLKASIDESYADMRRQLDHGNKRFEQIAQRHSDFDARIERLIQPISRAGLEAQRALELARKHAEALRDIEECLYGNKETGVTGLMLEMRRTRRTMDTWSTYAKIALAVWAIVQALLIPLIVALIRSGWHF
jgi:uncharacterized protein YdcH (DUF465 family)